MSRRRDIRKSDFTVVSSNESTDKFDFVRNGENLSIYQSDMAAGLGVTGTLEQLGEATAIPVLQVVGGVNYIRNILAGYGISVQVSPQNGVEINHNFTADSTGVPVMIDSASDSPTIRSIEGTSGVNVSGSGDTIQIALTASPASTKTVVVYDIDDFPTPVGSTITLEADTEYVVQNDISSAYIFEMSNNSIISGTDKKIISLETTNVGTMITATDVNAKIKDIKLIADSGTLFDISSTTGAHYFELYNTDGSCNNIGNFDNLAALSATGSTFSPVYVQGFTFTGSFVIALFSLGGIVMPSGTGNAFTLGTATFDYFVIDKMLLDIDTTGYSLSGLASSGNINADGAGIVLAANNFGSADASDNITPYDDRWESRANTKLPDSYGVLLASHAGTTVTIATVSTPVVIGATWTSLKNYRFTATAAGAFTYTGKSASASITLRLFVEATTGTDNYSFFVYLNGVQIPDSVVSADLTNGSPRDVTILWDVDLVPSDYIEFYVQNNDTNVDLTLNEASLRIRT